MGESLGGGLDLQTFVAKQACPPLLCPDTWPTTPTHGLTARALRDLLEFVSVDRERRVAELLANAQTEQAIELIEELPPAARSWQLHWNHGWALYKRGDTPAALTALR